MRAHEYSIIDHRTGRLLEFFIYRGDETVGVFQLDVNGSHREYPASRDTVAHLLQTARTSQYHTVAKHHRWGV